MRDWKAMGIGKLEQIEAHHPDDMQSMAVCPAGRSKHERLSLFWGRSLLCCWLTVARQRKHTTALWICINRHRLGVIRQLPIIQGIHCRREV